MIGNGAEYTQNDPNPLFADYNGSSCGNVCDHFHGPKLCEFTVYCEGSSAGGVDGFSANAPGTWTSNAPLSAAPEPATWAMMLAGVGGMGAALRARRRKIAAAAEHRTIHPMMM